MDYTKNRYLCIILITILFLFLRTYNIHNQSITFDEFIFISNTNILNLSKYLNLFLSQHPDYGLSPLTPLIIYFSSHLFNASIPAMRIIPIIFGLVSGLMVYSIGKKLAGIRVGMLAFLFFCLSPMNIWIQQEIKCYSFCLFFSLVSFYSLMKFLFSSKKSQWLILGFISNLVLPWLHPTYIFVPAIQIVIILFYLFLAKLKHKLFFLWTVQSIISCLTWTIWFFQQKSLLYIPNEPYKERLSLSLFFTHLFCNDSVGISADLLPEWKTNDLSTIINTFNTFWRVILPYWYVIDYLLAITILLFIFCFFISLMINFLNPAKYLERYKYLFLATNICTTVLIFSVLQFVSGNPYFTVQYFMYILPILYIITAIQIKKIQSHHMRFIISILLIVCFFMQSLSLICFKNRTDYKGAFEYLQKEIPHQGILLGQRFSSVYDVGKVYLKRNDVRYIPVLSLDDFIDKSYKILFGEPQHSHPIVFLLMEPSSIKIFGIENPHLYLSQHLEKKNMKVQWRYFPGEFNLFVGKVTKNNTNHSIVDNGSIYLANGFLVENLLYEFNLQNLPDIEKKRVLNILRNHFFIYPPFPVFYTLIISNLIWENELFIAHRICDKVIKEFPNFASIYLLKGILLLREGSMETAKIFINKSFEISPYLRNFYDETISKLTLSRSEDLLDMCRFIHTMDIYGFVLLDKALLSFCEK